MKKRTLVNRIVLFIVCIAISASFISLTNAVDADNNEAGFYVSASLPDNQLDENVSYFDLRVKPSAEQTIYVNIYNENDEEMEIAVHAANASSNSNGIIDYTKQGVTDASLKIPFENIAEPEEDVVKVPAGGRKKVGIDITMPEIKFDGIILGGLVFTEVDDEEQTSTSGSVEINNVVSYALAVKLSQNDKVQNINLNLVDVEARTVDHEPVITHYISNDAPALSTGMNMKIEIMDSESREVIDSAENDSVSIAPNSTMPYSYRLDGNKLEAGDYVSKVTITYTDKAEKEQIVQFEKEFSINEEQAKEAEEYNSVGESMPLWAKIMVGGIGTLILCVIILIAVILRKKKTNV